MLLYNEVDPYTISVDDSLMTVARKVQSVNHAERYSVTQGLLKTEEDFLGVAFKGVGPEFNTTFLKDYLLEGEIPQFSDSTTQYRLLMSKMIADKLKLKTGDKVFAYFIGDDDVKTRRFTVCGIYQTNMTRFDESLCFTDLYAVNRLNGWNADRCSGISMTVDDLDRLSMTELEVINTFNRTCDAKGNMLTSQTIYETYPQVFMWLELLDINVWIILALMVCVAGFTMISGLLIIILERTQMIGILKALGARNKTVRHTFLWFSVFIIGQGMFWGNVIGIGIVLIQQYTGIISLDPQSYYVSEAPMELNIPLILLLDAVTLLICIFVLIAPSYLISHIHPAKSMRYE